MNYFAYSSFSLLFPQSAPNFHTLLPLIHLHLCSHPLPIAIPSFPLFLPTFLIHFSFFSFPLFSYLWFPFPSFLSSSVFLPFPHVFFPLLFLTFSPFFLLTPFPLLTLPFPPFPSYFPLIPFPSPYFSHSFSSSSHPLIITTHSTPPYSPFSPFLLSSPHHHLLILLSLPPLRPRLHDPVLASSWSRVLAG